MTIDDWHRSRALADWFASQDINPIEAARLMLKVSGAIIGHEATNASHLEEGIKLAKDTVEEAARRAKPEKGR